jgi:hypothetical protein
VQFYFLYGMISGDALTMYMNFITHEDPPSVRLVEHQ